MKLGLNVLYIDSEGCHPNLVFDRQLNYHWLHLTTRWRTPGRDVGCLQCLPVEKGGTLRSHQCLKPVLKLRIRIFLFDRVVQALVTGNFLQLIDLIGFQRKSFENGQWPLEVIQVFLFQAFAADLRVYHNAPQAKKKRPGQLEYLLLLARSPLKVNGLQSHFLNDDATY